MLLSMGCEVDYYNITNEKSPHLEIDDSNFSYIHLYLEKKLSLRTVYVIREILKRLKNQRYDYYFIQDEELLILFIFAKKSIKQRLIIDSHEELSNSFARRLLLRTVYSTIKKQIPCITALHSNVNFLKKYFKNVHVFENYPLLSDFKIEHPSTKRDKLSITYVGTITEENRQMLKTLEVIDKLLENGKFSATLIGPIANRIHRDLIKSKIKQLELKYPKDFQYTGVLGRREVIVNLCKSDFLITLYSIPDDIQIAPNKLYEALAAGLIIITDHSNFSTPIPENLILKVEKTDTPEQIVQKVLNMCKSPEEIFEKKRYIRKWFFHSRLFWESYRETYSFIFRPAN
jgi:hypothetical protein